MPLPSRRRVLQGALGGFAVGALGAVTYNRLQAVPVATLRADFYDERLTDLLLAGIREFPDTVARVRGGRVVLKPNLVEWNANRPINTHPVLVAAAIEAFRRLGAREVVVAEGPGHRRDTELLLGQTGLGDLLTDLEAPFTDLNVDELERVTLVHNITGLQQLPIARTVLEADLLVSMPKLKTHHWAGATLSMKNLFGVVPGRAMGWPKNPLHFAGIPKSILDLWSSVPTHFAIVDGIVGMEGDGPIMGSHVDVGALILGEDLSAVDSTAARLMGLDPEKIPYLEAAALLGGRIHPGQVLEIGDGADTRSFSVLPHWEHIRV